MVNYISSRDNPLIRLVSSLKLKKNRDKTSMFFIEGVRFVKEALDSGCRIEQLLMSQTFYQENEMVEEILKKGIENYVIEDNLFKKISETTTPQGIMAVMKKTCFDLNKILENKNYNHFIIIIDGVRDPGNMGTIIRTAHAAGCHGVIVFKGSVDVFNPKTLRATMGSVFNVPIVYSNSKEKTIQKIREYGISIIAADVKGDTYPYEIDLTGPIALVVGNETKGISSKLLSRSSSVIRIPMPGGAESLNVAMATGIIAYEVIRQRKAFLSPIL